MGCLKKWWGHIDQKMVGTCPSHPNNKLHLYIFITLYYIYYILHTYHILLFKVKKTSILGN